MHLVIRTRPDISATWSDDEVALRWWTLFPQRRTSTGLPEQPTPEELNHIKSNASGVASNGSTWGTVLVVTSALTACCF
jgi:hypothetical protein